MKEESRDRRARRMCLEIGISGAAARGSFGA